jgi:hypothetical protein
MKRRLSGLCATAVGAMLAGGAQAAAKLPDWSGVWNPAERNIFDPVALPPPTAGAIPGYFPETSSAREYPPYTPEYEAKYEAVLKLAASGVGIDPTGTCLPPGFPRVMTTPMPLEFIVEPHRTTILLEAWFQVRRIWTDGRPHPADLEPSFNGHSVGRWEGDTLVVDTVGLRGDTPFDVTGAPHSDAMHVTERIRRRDRDTLEDRITVEDPKAFTRPWTVTRTYHREPDWQIAEYVCEENQRNPRNADGSTGFLHPPEPGK